MSIRNISETVSYKTKSRFVELFQIIVCTEGSSLV